MAAGKRKKKMSNIEIEEKVSKRGRDSQRSVAIVVVAYNRPDGMLRLLRSLEKADYLDESVPLIISIDHSGVSEVEEAAKAFQWSHGEKKIRTFETRQGLRKHILSCGEFLETYDALVVLEDDLIVSPFFYFYVRQSVDTYSDQKQIAGISLYAPVTNWNAELPFIPEHGASDAYFMQYAQSWGQIWLKDAWKSFMDWYAIHGEDPKEGSPAKESLIKKSTVSGSDIPLWVTTWKDTSWLKYHITYCIRENIYFVYPYVSLTTCFSDAGQHSEKTSTMFQTPLLGEKKESFILPELSERAIRYDGFFEREGLEQYLDINGKTLKEDGKRVTADLYGRKQVFDGFDYVVSMRELPFEKVRSFGLQLRPHDANVVYQIPGEELFLYDLHRPLQGTEAKVFPVSKKDHGRSNGAKVDDLNLVRYYFNLSANWKRMSRFFIGKMIEKVRESLGK